MSTNWGEKDDEIEIDLLELVSVLFHRIGIIILSAVLVAALAFGYTFYFVDPLYTASAMMYVNNSGINIGSTSVSITASELSAAQTLVDTYAVILQSRMTLEDVIERENLPYTYEELYDMIDVGAVNDTEIFQISVTSTSASEAEMIANTIVDILPEKIGDVVDGSDVRVVDYAVIPANRTSPSYTKNTAIGGIVGFLLSAAIIVIMYLFDEDIHSEEYLTKTYRRIPLLAVIPDMAATPKSGYGYGYGYGYGRGSGNSSNKRSSGQSGNRKTTDASSSRRRVDERTQAYRSVNKQAPASGQNKKEVR